MRDYWSPLLSRLILPEAVLEHWKRGVEQWKRCKGSDCLFAVDMAGVVWDLATFGASRQVKKLHLQTSGDTGEFLQPAHPYSLKRNFPLHRVFRLPPKQVSSWKGERV
jgi:hypothetical protein